ncbi:MAG: hypothetical protein KAH38_09350, partial [Candidatus Hydrogenedentes bacterium]|nr:hypothetical protein [Candidatus Hydrogenedentota bacterium]
REYRDPRTHGFTVVSARSKIEFWNALSLEIIFLCSRTTGLHKYAGFAWEICDLEAVVYLRGFRCFTCLVPHPLTRNDVCVGKRLVSHPLTRNDVCVWKGLSSPPYYGFFMAWARTVHPCT